ncbi:MAG TPA: metal ABC transporter substrate-binding protein [Bacillota bacterium]|nr:metal ABC transporter substrate-binding protein [Bacillota bacterium]
MPRKRLGMFGAILLCLLWLVGCGTPKAVEEKSATDHKIVIYTTIYPLADFAQKIAGDKAIVQNIVPPGTEPHDFEPTPKDIIQLNQAQIFVYNGVGFEGWVEKVVHSLNNKSLIVVDSSKQVDLLKASSSEQETGNDPHIWLDPNRAKKQAQAIKDALVQADPTNKEVYENNFAELAKKFDELDANLSDLSAHAKQKEMVVSHAAFGYLTHAYGLEEISIAGINPSDEPTQKDLQKIIETAKQHKIKYILFETLVSGKVAEVIKNELGAESLTLNPIESLREEDLAAHKDYFSVMKDNIETLKKALDYVK